MNTIDGDSNYYFWFDTYPMEFAVFLLDSSLARGTYYHTLSANDAFYERSSGDDDSGTDLDLQSVKVQFFCTLFNNIFLLKSQQLNQTLGRLGVSVNVRYFILNQWSGGVIIDGTQISKTNIAQIAESIFCCWVAYYSKLRNRL